MKKTLKQIITELSGFTTAHQQLQDFGFGDISNISTKDHLFPMMWINIIPSTNEGRQLNINLEMYIIDLLKQDRTNLIDVMSDTLLIGNDVVANYFDNEDDFDMVLDEESVNLTPFEAQFDDFTAGFVFEITLNIENKLNDCEIPD